MCRFTNTGERGGQRVIFQHLRRRDRAANAKSAVFRRNGSHAGDAFEIDDQVRLNTACLELNEQIGAAREGAGLAGFLRHQVYGVFNRLRGFKSHGGTLFLVALISAYCAI